MDSLNGKIYRASEILTGFFVLNLLWLITSLPVITAFPATAAMFGVVREWARNPDNGSVEPFFRHFKANFAQSLLIELIWTLFGIVLAFDFYVAGQVEEWLRVPMLLLLGAGVLAYSLTSMYLFPVMVNYEGHWRRVLGNSFLIAVSQLGTTVLCLLIVGLMLIFVLYIPLAILMAGSVTAYLVYTLCKRGFDRVEPLKALNE